MPITNISGVNSTTPECVDIIANADLVTTAVGLVILPRIAPTIAAAIEKRAASGNKNPMNMIACENAIRASSQLKKAVYERLSDEGKAYADQFVGFPDCAVDRIVPPVKSENFIDVVVESYYEWDVERSGFVGEIPQIPGMTLLAPASIAEQQDMLRWAIEEYNAPVAVRYPRGGNRSFEGNNWNPTADVSRAGALACHRMGKDITLVTYGTMLDNTMKAAQLLAEQGIEATVLRLLTVAPLPVYNVLTMMSENEHLVVVEEVAGGCGIREELAWELQHIKPGIRVDGIDLGRRFITHGDMNSLYRHYGLDGESIAKYVQEVHRS